ncbi:PLP-dependent aminotransferase family protein [Alloalcanivorax xenomutans]|uniref:PLP-dependent aminotransferase family protein n=1 Tax=Alloalcanivorax xenomutans TaxID=1094342 RepID=A0A9Q3ZGK3_9GAMM|nr:PLP-dependent aminotransferase family protein [Alloalcanivorax xenomutans]ERS15442.1 GntR family transcriptional regulator [Alcanivorax sp. PN-3]MBA4722989.1 PLP-dependent aminotransferase family protein [Alcanivorax sp.]ARB46474.1 GntR family transcriptional regulator [Alloalcanivorax xenomutans]MCE7509549.1 PLP-dependent aminotransferase family protein [Alloalcanivorax xenomutans]MCE7525634.1 PLP-dependent aminotransferase family protein [Alloalcanivorax xenomutans]
MTLYHQLADQLQALIEKRVYDVGQRLPGVRRLSHQHNVSVATAVSACRELEQRGVLEARPRSGYYVSRPPARFDAPRMRRATTRPRAVSGQDRVLELIQAVNDPSLVNFGAAVPDPDFMPVTAIERAFHSVLREQRRRCVGYEFPPGALELRQAIARRLVALQCPVSPDQVLITNSCQEAVTIALKLLTKPGDTVVVESPTYYGLLQVLESLGLKALEIPSDPRQGISLEALAVALERWPVKACVLVTNFANPLGSCLSDQDKQALLSLLSQHRVPLVEDDIYGDLPLFGPRPRPVKSWDRDGLVYYCASSSKTLSAGLRVGWLVPGGQQRRAEYLQFINTVSVATASQLAMARYLERGHYDRFLRQLRGEHAKAVARMTSRVEQLFPDGTRISRPAGGFVLWVELPGQIDTTVLAEQALQEGVSFAPGSLFSTGNKFSSCLRLNCAVRWDNRVEKGLARLAALL